jgi:hypothetical protein
MRKLKQITGIDPTQALLIDLRQGPFRDFIPALSRDEKRRKNANIQTIENHQVEILTFLETQDGIRQVFESALRDAKSKSHREQMLMVLCGI